MKVFLLSMKVRSKLILALTVIVCLAIVPISLYLIDTLEKSSIAKAREAGRAQSEFFAKSVLNLLLSNAGNLKATQVDALEIIKIFVSLESQGLKVLEALFLSRDPQRHGSVLVSWPHKTEGKKPVIDHLPEYAVDACSISPKEKCLVFTAKAGLANQPPNIAVKMEFAEANILAPVRQLRQSLLFAVLLAIVVVLLLGIITNLLIMKPLRSLEIATEQLAQGNLDYRITTNSKDEFGHLAMSFNSMSAALKKHILELEEKYRELNAARLIQQALLPQSLPVHPQVKFAARFLPMAEVGGDIYDVFQTPNGFAILVADVSGHGVPAALITAMAKMVIAGRPELAEKPSPMLHHLNQSLVGQTGNRFLTLVYAYFNPHTKKLIFANGGHPDILLVNRNDGSLKSYNARGTMIGVFPDQQYEQREIAVHPGERIIFLTDGILECFSPEGQMYEDVRLEKFLLDHLATDATVVCDLLMQDIQQFRGESSSLTDDATVVVVDVNTGDSP